MNGPEDIKGYADAAAEEAAAWHVRLYAEDASEADFLAFEAWIADPTHRAAFDAIELLNEVVRDRASDLVEALDAPAGRVLPFRRPSAPARSAGSGVTRRLWLGGALAAGLAAIAVAPALMKPPLRWTTYQTAPGETRAVRLEDGSVINMNAASTLKVAFTPKERRVEMADAEATFDVAKNPNRPFLIAARDHEIRVVGTEFNVFNFDGTTRVTVRRGIVQVRRADAQQAVRLLAGQEFEQRGAASQLTRNVDPETAFAWRSGQLIYADARLTDVVSALNRRFSIPMRLDGAAGDVRFSGVLTLDSEEAVVRRLEAFMPITAEHSGEEYVLRRRIQP